ncbi:hypothetical protein RJ640_013990, partial [Escallonia rubra]
SSTVTGATTTTSSSDIDSDTTKLWHMRLGHMSERGVDVLRKQGLLGSKKTEKLGFCEHCVFGKQYRVKFSQAVHTTKDEEDGSHSTEENEEPQEHQYIIARNKPKREIRYGYRLIISLNVTNNAYRLKPSYKDNNNLN